MTSDVLLPDDSSTTAETGASESGGFAPRAETKKTTLTIPLIDGKFEAGNLRGSTRKKLEALVASQEFAKEFKLAPVNVSESMVAPEFVDQLMGMVSSSQAMLFSWKLKIPYQLALRICTYSREELEMLRPPARRLIAKYMPEVYSKWGDEIAVGGMLLNFTLAKGRAAAELAKKYHDELAKQQGVSAGQTKPNGHAEENTHSPVAL